MRVIYIYIYISHSYFYIYYNPVVAGLSLLLVLYILGTVLCLRRRGQYRVKGSPVTPAPAMSESSSRDKEPESIKVSTVQYSTVQYSTVQYRAGVYQGERRGITIIVILISNIIE